MNAGTTVFDAFPNAIVRGVWKLGEVEKGTIVGTKFTVVANLDIIEDEVVSSKKNEVAGVRVVESDTLLYVRPEQLPTTSVPALTGDYCMYNSDEDEYYEIVEVGKGKNQQDGTVEHFEFILRPTEIAEAEDEPSV